MKTHNDISRKKDLQALGAPSTTLTRIVGILLIVGAIAVPTLLILHDMLGIDEDSGALAFPVYQQHPIPIFLTYYALMATGVLFVLLGPLMYHMYARLQTPLRMLVLICMVVAGSTQMIAASRWLIVLPYFSHSYTNPQTDAATRAALDVAYKGTSYFLGLTIGEFFYNIFTGLWSVFLVVMLRRLAYKAWFNWIGIIGGVGIMLGSFEQIFVNTGTGSIFLTILTVGHVAWVIWMVGLAISLLINKPSVLQRETQSMVQEQMDLSTEE
jgi:hypothetical protein